MFTFKTIIILLIAIFMLTGCGSETEEKLSIGSVRMLIGREGVAPAPPITFIEFEEPNVFRFISFRRIWYVVDNNLSDKVFDITQLDDFISKAPRIETTIHVFGDSHNEVIDEWLIELSQEQLESVKRMVRNIARNREDREFEWVSGMLGHIPYVWVIIDDKMYWSYYTHDTNRYYPRDMSRYINNHLLSLAYKLIDLSPEPVGGENPFPTP